MLLMAAIVVALVPIRQPVATLSYGQLLGSLLSLFKDTEILRRRAFYQANVFAAFTLFWTAVPIELARAHAFPQSKIALFSLIDAAGAVSGPLGGRLTDAGRSRLGTFIALWGVTIALFLSATPLGGSVLVLAACAIVIDFCVQLNLVIGQRNIYQLPAHHRGRLTALYMTSVFIGGSIGSAISSGLYAFDGRTSVALVAGAFPLLGGLMEFEGTTVAAVQRSSRE